MIVMEPWETNLKKRKKVTWANLFHDEHNSEHKDLSFFLSPSDEGVIRNGGRRGAKHGPSALMTSLKRLGLKDSLPYNCREYKTTSQLAEKQDFDQAQNQQYLSISEQLTSHCVHFGGGHDHIYPFARSISEKHESLYIINIDAHLDTRQDPIHHSGTPFRQLKNELGDRLFLTQIGIQSSANVKENYDNVEMDILTMDDIKRGSWRAKLKAPKKEAALILSIDCDGIDSSLVSAVSAVNPDGLLRKDLDELSDFVKGFWKKHHHLYVGIYEFNPVLDDLSGRSAKFIVNYLNQLLS